MIVSVSVATIWTTPEKPREMDRIALQNPADIRGWLESFSIEDRLQLWRDNMVQTQVLYGTTVHVTEEHGDWVKVVIPDQSCHKDERGYPGWMPKCQLAPESAMQKTEGLSLAVVKKPTAFLYPSENRQGMEVSFVTQLPVLETNDLWTKVATPHGPQLLKTDDAMIWETVPPTDETTGQSIVDAGKMFLGLRYFWGGMSAFGYDCSGFAYNMHRAHGIIIPRDADDQSNQGKWVEKADLQAGDLLFFAHDEGKGSVHHVGIYVADHTMIHSPDSQKSVELLTLTGHMLEKELIVARRYW